uniref:Uncharacterized protein n=1 Tax=Anguilla anguilla TaxID=7936 RepID=A0A0E9R1G3_ANGAN
MPMLIWTGAWSSDSSLPKPYFYFKIESTE